MITLSTVTNESVQLLNGLKNSGVRFAHWKSNCRLKQSLEGKTDLDLLIHPESREKFEDCMLSLGYKKLLSPPWSSYPGVEDYIAFDQETGNFLHLHIHYALVTGIKHVKHLSLPWTDIFFKHLTADPSTGWPIPETELEAIILFIRIAAKMPPKERRKKTRFIPSHLKEELVGLLLNSSIESLMDLLLELNLKIPRNFRSNISKIIHEHDADDILTVAEDFYQQVKPFYRKNWWMSIIQSNFYHYYLRISRHAPSTFGPISYKKKVIGGGKIIAFIGSDGSGKSTLTQDLIHWLSYKIDCHYMYLGKRPFIYSNGKQIKSFFRWFSGGNLRSRISKKALKDYYFIWLIKEKLRMLKLAHKLKERGSVVICDRFPQLKINGINDGMNLQMQKGRQGAKLEKSLFNQTVPLEADLVFKLIVSPEVALQRKPEHDFQMIKKKCDIISQINFSHSKLVTIDADQPYSQVLLQIKNEIWRNL